MNSYVKPHEAKQNTSNAKPLTEPQAAVLYAILHQRYRYSNGLFYWKHNHCDNRSGRPISEPVGGLNSEGYRVIKIKGRLYKYAQIVWLYHTGTWPAGQMDHIDRDRANDTFINLRVVNCKQQQNNRATSLAVRMGW